MSISMIMGIASCNNADIEKVADDSENARFVHDAKVIQRSEDLYQTEKPENVYKEKPLSIVGRVIDQGGNPVGGVRIGYDILRASYMFDGTDTDKVPVEYTEANERGEFQILNRMAMILNIVSMDKPGMRWIPSRGSQLCSAKEIDNAPSRTSTNPLVLLMVTENRGEPISIDRKLAFRWNSGTSIHHIEDIGIVINITANRSKRHDMGESFDWNIDIAIEDGGIQELHADGPMLAPIDGYMPDIRYTKMKDEPNWSTGIGSNVIQVYKTSSGNYGTLEIHTYTAHHDDLDSATIKICHNPTGERYLR